MRAGRHTDSRVNARTAKALEGAAGARQRAKLRKKLAKQAEKDAAKEDGPMSRRKRFTQPDKSFGKRSLVYHLKFGNLKELADNTKIQEPVQAKSFRSMRRDRAELLKGQDLPDEFQKGKVFEQRGARDESTDERKEGRRERMGHARDHGSSRSEGNVRGFGGRDREGRRDKPDRPRDRDVPGKEGNAREFGGRNRESRNDDRGSARRDDRREDRPRSREDRDPEARSVERAKKGGFMPMTIKYTTAASQFLYGRSVVKAALMHRRRKLYHLYIYGGQARKDSSDERYIRNLAARSNVPVTVVPAEEQRLMDKMSSGRPHNGYVLETSPLPQRPVTGLGPVEERPDKLGFHITLDQQSREELDINGDETFVPRGNSVTPKPFVLLLNEIVDPGNLGAMIRTARYLGVDAVGVTSRSSSTLTPVTLKSASGAVEEVTLFTIDSPQTFLENSSAAGWKTFAAVAPPERKLMRLHNGKFLSTDDLAARRPLSTDPCILVLGNEGFGLPKHIKQASDYEISVPQFVHDSSVDSLNVSVAAGLLCHAFVGPSASTRKVSLQEQIAAREDLPAVDVPGAEKQEKSEDDLF